MVTRGREPLRDVAAVLFDMDGLLVDSEPKWSEALDAFCVRRGCRYTEEDALACVGRGIPNSARYLSEKYGWPLDVAAHVAEIEDEFRALAASAPPMKGAVELLAALHGRIPIALGSSTVRRLVEAALGARSIDATSGRKSWLELFDVTVTGSDVERVKPAPDIYLACAAKLGVRPEGCVVLEDSLAGCEAARAAGMRVIAVPAGNHAPFRDLAHVIATDLLDAAYYLPPSLGARALSAVKAPGTPHAM